MTRRFFCLWVALGLVGCQSSVPFDPAGEAPPASLGGAFSPDSTWSIRLTGVTPYGGTTAVPYLPPLSGATVTVTDALTGAAVGLTETQAGRYEAPASPVAGRRYVAGAVLATGERLRAAGEAIAAPRFTVLSAEGAGRDPAQGSEVGLYRVTVRFHAATGDESLMIAPVRPDGTVSDAASVFSADDADLRDNFADDGPVRVQTEFAPRAVYLAPLAESRTVTFLFRVPLSGAPPSLRLIVTALSADLRRHLASVDRQNAYGNTPFVEPVRVFTNVEGGVGIFAGYAARDTVLALPAP